MHNAMHNAPRILGVNRTQDASICLMEGSRLIFAIQKERLTRQKHHWGKVDDFRSILGDPRHGTVRDWIDAA